MSCPHFYPVERIGLWSGPERMPLGDPYRGRCHADPHQEWSPDEEMLVGFCNVGYARSRCPRFPAGDGADAVRFVISADDGERLVIQYATERGYLPHSCGTVEYTSADMRLSAPLAPPLDRQILAFAGSYLRRKAAR